MRKWLNDSLSLRIYTSIGGPLEVGLMLRSRLRSCSRAMRLRTAGASGAIVRDGENRGNGPAPRLVTRRDERLTSVTVERGASGPPRTTSATATTARAA